LNKCRLNLRLRNRLKRKSSLWWNLKLRVRKMLSPTRDKTKTDTTKEEDTRRTITTRVLDSPENLENPENRKNRKNNKNRLRKKWMKMDSLQ